MIVGTWSGGGARPSRAGPTPGAPGYWRAAYSAANATCSHEIKPKLDCGKTATSLP